MKTETNTLMKISKYLAFGLLAISLMPVWGQGLEIGGPATFTIDNKTGSLVAPAESNHLTKFNLDFPGGTPKELVAAIEKATGKPLNAIIPDEDAGTQLPSLKMNDVSVPQLFAALEVASHKTVLVMTGGAFGNSYSQQETSCGFKTSDNETANSIWYFYADKPTLPPAVSTQKICQFYSLAPYLNNGFTVDDITTAIQTGWKMAGVTSPPDLNYHKETGLLIAFGEPGELKTISDVLATLPQIKSDSWNQIYKDIYQLRQQVKELQGKVSTSSTNSPAEKSGK